jgi:SAM-dependent MidA family methyltransferase
MESPPRMTALAQVLAARIRAHGPMSLADYMADCLLHPQHGYYTTQNPFGSGGDFITAPDISQMFGELLGLSLAQAWLDQGAPDPFTLAELGPGRGTLMADILRATKAVAGFHAAMRVVLVARTVRVPLTVIALLSTLASTPLGLAASPIVLVAALMPIAAPIATL